MKNKLFIFNLIEDILFFSPLLGDQLFFLNKSQRPPPPEYQMVRPESVPRRLELTLFKLEKGFQKNQ